VQKIQDLFTVSLFMTKQLVFDVCVMSARRVIGPIFYDYTVNAVRYANNMCLLGNGSPGLAPKFSATFSSRLIFERVTLNTRAVE
jgi:hypothetical protein